jgi:hypothetical protein
MCVHSPGMLRQQARCDAGRRADWLPGVGYGRWEMGRGRRGAHRRGRGGMSRAPACQWLQLATSVSGQCCRRGGLAAWAREAQSGRYVLCCNVRCRPASLHLAAGTAKGTHDVETCLAVGRGARRARTARKGCRGQSAASMAADVRGLESRCGALEIKTAARAPRPFTIPAASG